MKREHLIICLAVLTAFSSCGKSGGPSADSQKPAKVENAVPEAALSTVTLSPTAEERLGIETFTVESRRLPGRLELGGEIIAVPGGEVQVSAPVAGTVLRPDSGTFPRAGKIFKKGEEVLRLLMFPAEKELIGAREEAAVREEEFKVARAKADRAEHLLSSKAISEKAFEETRAELARAKASLDAAAARLKLLSGVDPEAAAGGLSTLVLESPVDGVLQRIFVAPGQTVPAATALFEVASLQPVWVRAPLYIGDLARIDLKAKATVIPLGTGPSQTVYSAEPVQGPPLSDPGSASADLFYELANNERSLRIGQKVKISLLLESPEESLAVPASALLYDINGGKWVYVRTAPHVSSRRRVEVRSIIEGYAVLTRGLNPGDEVVTAGAEEIFGTEFGVGK